MAQPKKIEVGSRIQFPMRTLTVESFFVQWSPVHGEWTPYLAFTDEEGKEEVHALCNITQALNDDQADLLPPEN